MGIIKRIQLALKSDKNLKELLSGSAITIVLKAIGMFLSYLVIALISRQYGAEGAGIYTLLLNLLISISIICTLGLDVAVLRYVGQYGNFENGKGKIKIILNHAFKLSLPISLCASFLMFYFSENIATNVFKNDSYKEGIKIIAVILPLYTLSLICIEFIRGLKKLKISELLRTVIRPLIIIIILYFFTSFNNIIESIYALSIAVIVLSLSALLFVINYFKNSKTLPNINHVSKRELLKTSFPMMIIMAFTSILGNSGSYFLEFFTITEEVGMFNVCFKVAQLIGIVLLVVNTIAAPKFAELYWSHKKSELKKVLNQTSLLNLMGGFMIATVLFLFSEVILGFFGQEFVKAKNILLILIIGQAINCFLGSVGIFLTMIGHQKQLGQIIVFSTFIILLGYYFVVPEYGITGAAIVSSCGYVFFNLLCVVYAYKKLNFLPFNFRLVRHDKT